MRCCPPCHCGLTAGFSACFRLCMHPAYKVCGVVCFTLQQAGCELSHDAEDDALAQRLRHLAPGYVEVALEVLGGVAFRDSDEDSLAH
eukprot:5317001-Amphidinium_carterae.2